MERVPVTFDTFGGRPGPTIEPVLDNAAATPPSPEPTWGGNVLVGWSTTVDGSSGFYNFATPVTGPVTLYAQWHTTVSFNLNGVSGTAPGPQTFATGSTVTMPPDPSSPGYTFAGWTFAPTLNDNQWNYAWPALQPMTLYAQWQTTLAFDLNGAPGAPPATINLYKGASVGNGSSLFPANPTWPGHTFYGWSTTPDGYRTDSFYSVTDPMNAPTTLYAQWNSPITMRPTLPPATYYEFYQEYMNPSGGVSPYTFTTDGAGLAALNSAELTLQTNGQLVSDTTIDPIPASTPSSITFTVTAVDTRSVSTTQTYTIQVQPPTLGLSPSSLPTGTVGVPFSQQLTATGVPSGAPAPTFTLQGSTVDGLTLSSDGLLSGTPAGSDTNNEGPFVLSIQMTIPGLPASPDVVMHLVVDDASQVVLTLDRHNGTPLARMTLPIGSPLSDLPLPTRDGWTFSGYYTKHGGGDPVTRVPRSGIVHAQWTKVEVSPGSVVVGQQVTVSGFGFWPRESVSAVLHSTPLDLGAHAAHANGNLRFTVTVPADFPLGTHTVVLSGATSGRTVKAELTVTKAVGSLARTGRRHRRSW